MFSSPEERNSSMPDTTSSTEESGMPRPFFRPLLLKEDQGAYIIRNLLKKGQIVGHVLFCAEGVFGKNHGEVGLLSHDGGEGLLEIIKAGAFPGGLKVIQEDVVGEAALLVQSFPVKALKLFQDLLRIGGGFLPVPAA